MRRFHTIVVLTIMVFCTATLFAQAGGTPPTADQRLQQLATQLNLTDDQKAKIKPVVDDETNQLQALHQDTSLSREDKMAKAREIHSKSMSEIRPMLTADQQKQLDAMSAHAKERMHEHHQNQAPPQ